jgi:hypothetical protein
VRSGLQVSRRKWKRVTGRLIERMVNSGGGCTNKRKENASYTDKLLLYFFNENKDYDGNTRNNSP